AKAGLNQLTVSIALTYADRGIRANAILPGLIDTPLVSAQLSDRPESVAARHARSPTGRMGSPHDVANAAVFLASDRAAYIHGARIARLAADLHELLDHLDVGSAHMGGHSMGASVLWSYIDTHGTSRLNSLVLIDQPSACVVLPWLEPEEAAQAGAILNFTGA